MILWNLVIMSRYCNVNSCQFVNQDKEIFYFEDGKECDFVIKFRRGITHAIQVTDNLSNPSTRKREIEGLKVAMGRFNLSEGTIVTLDSEGNIKEDNKKIHIIPDPGLYYFNEIELNPIPNNKLVCIQLAYDRSNLRFKNEKKFILMVKKILNFI